MDFGILDNIQFLDITHKYGMTPIAHQEYLVISHIYELWSFGKCSYMCEKICSPRCMYLYSNANYLHAHI